jgi:hypothetical protein
MPMMISSISDAGGIGTGFPSNPQGEPKGDSTIIAGTNVNGSSQTQGIDKYITDIQNSIDNLTYNALGKNPSKTNNGNNNNNTGAKSNDIQFQLPGQKKLSAEEQKAVADLQKIDSQVRAHENAHRTAGDGLVQGVTSFTYTTGPDGKQYATGGEVQIDVSPVNGDPEATIQKMERVIAAALAPVDPSSQDRSVASLASSIELSARMEEAQQNNPNNNSNIQQTNNAINAYQNAQQSSSQSQNSNNENNLFTGIAGSVASLNKFA